MPHFPHFPHFPMKPRNAPPRIVGVGSALMDILLFESDRFLADHGVTKGGMQLVGPGRADQLLAASPNLPRMVPGGSACNTTIGLGRLGARAEFVGTRGDDEVGRILEAALLANNVTPRLETVATPTGRVLSIVTPDAERSMLTCLGASSEMSPRVFTPGLFAGADLVHVEGYLLFNEALIRSALEAAREAGVPVSLDLASFTVVDANPSLVRALVREYVDVLLANEDEARSYTGGREELEALGALAADAECAALKVGGRGSYVSLGGETTVILPCGECGVVDTTGAGDLWAAGFLFGLTSGLPVGECGRIASMCGYEVCRVEGAHIPDEGWGRILSVIGR